MKEITLYNLGERLVQQTRLCKPANWKLKHFSDKQYTLFQYMTVTWYMQYDINSAREKIRPINIAHCLAAVELRSCGNWTIINGMTDTAIIIAE